MSSVSCARLEIHIPVFLTIFIKRLSFLQWFYYLVENLLTLDVWIFFRMSLSLLLIFVSVLMLVPTVSVYRCLVLCFEVRYCDT